MSNDLDLFDYMNPDKPEPIYAGTRRTDPEEVKLVVDAELQIAHGRPGVKPNLFKRTNGAAVLSFETSSERDYNAMRSAFDGFRRRFKITRECRGKNDYRVSDTGMRWMYELELEFGRFVE